MRKSRCNYCKDDREPSASLKHNDRTWDQQRRRCEKCDGTGSSSYAEMNIRKNCENCKGKGFIEFRHGCKHCENKEFINKMEKIPINIEPVTDTHFSSLN